MHRIQIVFTAALVLAAAAPAAAQREDTFRWSGQRNYVRLDPAVSAGHVLAVSPGGQP